MSRTNISISRDWTPIRLGTLTRALHLLLVLAVLLTVGALSQAQSNFTVIHNFNGLDGGHSYSAAALTLDRLGNLYGTAPHGGTAGRGTVYELAHVNGSWIMHTLYSFAGQNDGMYPSGGVTIGPDGTLFGTTEGGGPYDAGTLFNLKPPAHACPAALCPWTEKIIHSFNGNSDGFAPEGNVVFDSQGNLYGTTFTGGEYPLGTVYKARRSGATWDPWNVSVIYSFGPGNHGKWPAAGVVLDRAGNLYGTTSEGGLYGNGTVYELSPSGGDWIEKDLHAFEGGSGCWAMAGLVIDRAGNLYGGTYGGQDSCSSTFELSPQGGDWNFTIIRPWPQYSTLAIDSAGNLYGVGAGLYGHGQVWELSPSSDGGWIYTDLYDFTGGNDGDGPTGSVTVTGPDGYLYGATMYGGTTGNGVIYQIDLSGH